MVGGSGHHRRMLRRWSAGSVPDELVIGLDWRHGRHTR
jgi:hypothetical protein